MKRISQLAVSAVFLASSTLSFAAIKTRTVEYKKGNDTFEGVLVYSDTVKGKAPGILMIHNWMGVSDETKKQATRMAELGYAVFAADIYGKGVRPTNPEEAGKLAASYRNGDRKLFRERLNLGLETLRGQKEVDSGKVLAVGYCFGGTGVLELARTGADVKGFVSFHGGLDSPAPADGKNIKGKVLALHGADDPFVKAEDLAAFEKEMRDNKVDWQLVKYGNAVHSFTEQSAGNDSSKGAAYSASADARSFTAFKDFAKANL